MMFGREKQNLRLSNSVHLFGVAQNREDKLEMMFNIQHKSYNTIDY